MDRKLLPIWVVMSQVIASLREKSSNVVVTSPTGSGKTTQIPQELLDSGVVGDRAIIVVQPRKVACRAGAKRIAEERGLTLGQEVGYMVRYENRISPNTRICFVTDGVFSRLIESNAALDRIGAVVFDEFHERRVTSDLALALMREAQLKGSAARIVAMSATMDASLVAKYLDAPIVEGGGRTFPVEVEYAAGSFNEENLPQVIAKTVERLHLGRSSGDILVFLPGKAEIQVTQRLLRRRQIRGGALKGVAILPLHGELPEHEQDRVFQLASGRKVILATNVAETALTISGVTMVMDAGLERRLMFNPATGVDTLVLTRISQASAEQRAGRAGRETPGLCVRLWSEKEHAELEATTPPEIQRTDLSNAILTLKAVGVKNISQFRFLEKPTAEQISSAEELLKMLGALDEEGELTKNGRLMLGWPLPVRYARMMVEAERSGCAREMATITAMLAGRPVFLRPPGKEQQAADRHRALAIDDSSDLFTFLEVFTLAHEHEFSPEWCDANYLNYDALLEVRRLRGKIKDLVLTQGFHWNQKRGDRSILRRSIAAGLVDRLGRKSGRRSFEIALGVRAKVDDASVVDGEFVVAAEVRTTKTLNLVSLLTRIDLSMMEQLAPRLFKTEREVVERFPLTGRARVRTEQRYLKLVLDTNTSLVQEETGSLTERLGSVSASVAKILKKPR